MNEYQIVELLIAYWPLIRLEVARLLPIPSMLLMLAHQGQDEEIDSIAKLLERKLSDGSTLIDYIVMGLVNKQKNLSRLKIVDFHGCSSSKNVCSRSIFILSCRLGVQMTKEIFRLPLLWIAPERRYLLQRRMCRLSGEVMSGKR